MALTQPGSYVLYRERGGEQLSWPGVTVPDDLAPQNVHKERPSGCTTLVLLFGATYRFRWATTPQLAPFIPITDDFQHNLPPELLQAFHTADFGLDARLDMDYWRDEVAQQLSDETLPGPNAEADLDCDDLGSEEELDEQLREAMRISLREFQDQTSGIFPTPSCSPPAIQRKRKRRRSDPFESSDNDTEDDHDSLYSWPTKGKPTTVHCVSPLRQGNGFGQASSNAFEKRKTSYSSTGNPSSRCDEIGSTKKAKTSRYYPAGPINLDRFLRQGHGSAAPTSDNIEGDISESKDFVRIPVGPDREIRTLLKAHVWDRTYFRDSRSGMNRFELKDDNIWELHHPELVKLDPADFQFLAEYLTDGEFGLRFPEGPEQTNEAIAQCVSAWEAGDKLGMFDLLEHIVEKVKFFEWDDANMLILAVIVYRVQDPPTPAHEAMREWLSGYLAHHFWEYVWNEAIGHLFRRRVKAIPDLERQVFEKRAAMLASGAEMSDDEGSDGDGL